MAADTLFVPGESDFDDDGLPDDWEKAYFGSSANGDPPLDGDGDG